MPLPTSRHASAFSRFLRLSRPPRAWALGASLVVAAASAGVGGCSSGPPYVDPRPMGDGGIAERMLIDSSLETSAVEAGNDGSLDTSINPGTGGGGGAGGDGGADVASGDAADAVPSAQLAVSIVTPERDSQIVKGKERFVPSVQVSVTLPLGAAPDDLAGATAELWTTGTSPLRVSSTLLTVSGHVGAESARVTTYTLNDSAVDLSGLASGNYELKVTATSTSLVTAQASRLMRVDAGPSITVASPVANKSYRGSLGVQVRIDDALFGPVKNVVMSLGAYVIPNVKVSSPPLDYQVTVATTDTIPPLDGAQLLKISAENANGTVSVMTVPFVFDSTGPIVADTVPATGQLIGGVITIRATITDLSGVDPTSVIAVMAHGSTQFEVKLAADALVPNLFRAQFDTRLFDIHAVYPTVSFRAADVPGNQSSVGYQVELDNTPPVADLDPAPVRMRRKNPAAMTGWECSWGFDPLGSDAVSDGDAVTQLFDIRARVQDLGNEPVAGGQDIMPLSLVDPTRVELLVLDDTTQPLVVDSDNDGICDKINPTLIPTSLPMSSTDALLVNLAPIPPSGTADFTPDSSLQSGGYACDPGIASQAGEPLCLTTDLRVALSYTDANEPAIWTIPTVAPGLKCVGLQFDSFANHINDGVACLAVRAVDRLGNSQVSGILRVCIDHDLSGGDCPGFHPLSSVSGGTLTTPTPHGLATGDTVIVSRSYGVPSANGRFTITVTSATQFTLNGVTATTGLSTTALYTTPAELPDCTGIQTVVEPPAVSTTKRCTPWREYPSQIITLYQ